MIRHAGLILLLLGCLGCGTEPTRPVAVGEPLPSFELPTLDGATSGRDDLVGRPTVIAFWATWCQPCLREIPLLQELHADPRLDLVTIALDEGGATVLQPFAERRGLDYPILLGNQETFQRLGGLAIPYALVIDAQGTIVDLLRGPVVRERVEYGLFGDR